VSSVSPNRHGHGHGYEYQRSRSIELLSKDLVYTEQREPPYDSGLTLNTPWILHQYSKDNGYSSYRIDNRLYP
jgi:hypothetical protein